MTLEQKVGQVLLVGFDGTTLTPELRDDLTQLHIGGVIYYDRNISSPQQVAQLNVDLQNALKANGDLPLFITVDQEGGIVARLKEDKGFTEFPGQMAVAATGNVENVRRIAQAISDEMLALGFNMDLTPDLDVNNNPQNPIIGTRSFGSDPARVAEYGVAFVEAMQGAGMIAIGKHFPGHGDTGVDSHVTLPTVPHDRARLEAVEFVPFQAAMKARVAGIMSAHITFPAIDPTPGLAATLSPRVLTDLVRGEMKYDGLVMTDELTMGALATSGYPAPQAASASLRAGADVLLFQTGYAMHRQVHALLVEHVRRGVIPPARLDEAVRRILLAKQHFGILTEHARRNMNLAMVGSTEIRALSRDVAAQAVTLVRDDANNLAKVASASAALRSGQPSPGLLVVETGAFGLGKALGATTMQVKAQPTQSEMAAILQIAKDGRAVIVATSDVAKNRAQADLVNALLKANAPTVVVAVRSPYDLMYLDAPTYLATYGSNPPMIEALANVLTGKAPARGKLPVELK
jgi:beta-N-acetylhexosaminidase